MLSYSKYFIGSLFICALFFLGLKDGEKKGKPYPELEAPQLAIQGDDGAWDEKKVHTFSIVEANKDGYKYWGYYGLDHYSDPAYMRKGGLVRSNDLVNWEKYSHNPVIDSNCRWPTAVIADGVFHVYYAEYKPNIDSRIVHVTSKDGIHFSKPEEIVPFKDDHQNQNPFIFYNQNDQKYYLFYYSGRERGDSLENNWNIKVKSAKNITDLKTAESKTIMSSKSTIAAPSVAYYNGKFYLLIEALNPKIWGNTWVTLGYESSSPDKDYVEVSNNPVLKDDDACAFQYVLNGELYITYSHRIDAVNNDWVLKTVKAKGNE